VKGKFGSSQSSKSSKVLMFHTEDEGERDRLFRELQTCAQKVDPNPKVFCQRACTNLYLDLLGDWGVERSDQDKKPGCPPSPN